MESVPASRPPKRRVYRVRPLVWFGPLLVGTFYTLYGFSSAISTREKLVILTGAAIPCAFLLLISLRTRMVIESDGLRLYQAFKSEYVPWSVLEGAAIRMHGRPQQELVVLAVAGGRAVAVTGPGPGIFGSKYAREAVEDIEAARRAAADASDPNNAECDSRVTTPRSDTRRAERPDAAGGAN